MHRLSNCRFLKKTVSEFWAFAVCAVVAHSLSSAAMAQSPPPAAARAASSASTSAPLPPKTAPVSKPAWAELSPAQQQSLKPLAASWNTISEPQKRKWLEVSKNYSKLSSVEQTTLHSRMVEWVAMSPQDRAAARLNFAKTKELSNELTGDEKKAKWQTYQALSPEEKAKLAANASPKPTGAATAVKPVPPQKLAVTPKNSPQPTKLPLAAPTAPSSDSTLNAAPTTTH